MGLNDNSNKSPKPAKTPKAMSDHAAASQAPARTPAVKLVNVESPNFTGESIPVEFLVLHYTACTLQDALRLFTTREKKLCAHFVLDVDGVVYDLGDFWNAPIRQGAHAGVSRFAHEGREWESFNRFSIGIEIVNLNGNLIPYPAAQYESLAALTRHLCARFPALRDPNRVVGHEQIAGFRGKSDPGRCFDWELYFRESYPDLTPPFPARPALVTDELWREFQTIHGPIDPDKMGAGEWSALSSRLETFMGRKRPAAPAQA